MLVTQNLQGLRTTSSYFFLTDCAGHHKIRTWAGQPGKTGVLELRETGTKAGDHLFFFSNP